MLDMLKEIGVDVITNVATTEVVKLENGADCYGEIDYIKVNDTHEYECDIFLDLSTRRVAKDVFTVLTDACLVYDGALVIQPDFSTSNGSILSAGTMTKYPRRLHADQWTHSQYNSEDVGQAVAIEIIERIQNKSQNLCYLGIYRQWEQRNSIDFAKLKANISLYLNYPLIHPYVLLL